MERRTVAKLTEADVIRQCLDWLACHGISLERQNTGGLRNTTGRYVAFGKPGAADYLGTVPGSGKRLCVEFKAPGWRPRGNRQRERFARQVAYLNKINAEGGVGLLIDHVDVLAKVWPLVVRGARVLVRNDGVMVVTRPAATPEEG